MPSKARIRRRFLEKISGSKPKRKEIIDHHVHVLPDSVMQPPKVQVTPDSVKDIEIYGNTEAGSGYSKTECQDTFSVLYSIAHHIHYFAVYDGHGPSGRLVSEFVNKTISSSLTKYAAEMEKAVDMGSPGTFFSTLFKAVDNKLMDSPIDSATSGSCGVSVMVSNNKCYIANVGDSRATLCRQNNLGQVTVVDLSSDHKPTRQDEQMRIIQAGGIVEPSMYNGTPVGPLRVWNQARETGLAMTRGFGDSKGKQAGIIADPELTQLDLGPDDKFIIVASDGVWDVMSSQEAILFVVNYLSAGRAKSDAAKALTAEARTRWTKTDVYQQALYVDDITVVIGFLKYHPPQTTYNTIIDSNMQTQTQAQMP